MISNASTMESIQITHLILSSYGWNKRMKEIKTTTFFGKISAYAANY